MAYIPAVKALDIICSRQLNDQVLGTKKRQVSNSAWFPKNKRNNFKSLPYFERGIRSHASTTPTQTSRSQADDQQKKSVKPAQSTDIKRSATDISGRGSGSGSSSGSDDNNDRPRRPLKSSHNQSDSEKSARERKKSDTSKPAKEAGLSAKHDGDLWRSNDENIIAAPELGTPQVTGRGTNNRHQAPSAAEIATQDSFSTDQEERYPVRRASSVSRALPLDDAAQQRGRQRSRSRRSPDVVDESRARGNWRQSRLVPAHVITGERTNENPGVKPSPLDSTHEPPSSSAIAGEAESKANSEAKPMEEIEETLAANSEVGSAHSRSQSSIVSQTTTQRINTRIDQIDRGSITYTELIATTTQDNETSRDRQVRELQQLREEEATTSSGSDSRESPQRSVLNDVPAIEPSEAIWGSSYALPYRTQDESRSGGFRFAGDSQEARGPEMIFEPSEVQLNPSRTSPVTISVDVDLEARLRQNLPVMPPVPDLSGTANTSLGVLPNVQGFSENEVDGAPDAVVQAPSFFDQGSQISTSGAMERAREIRNVSLGVPASTGKSVSEALQPQMPPHLWLPTRQPRQAPQNQIGGIPPGGGQMIPAPTAQAVGPQIGETLSDRRVGLDDDDDDDVNESHVTRDVISSASPAPTSVAITSSSASTDTFAGAHAHNPISSVALPSLAMEERKSMPHARPRRHSLLAKVSTTMEIDSLHPSSPPRRHSGPELGRSNSSSSDAFAEMPARQSKRLRTSRDLRADLLTKRLETEREEASNLRPVKRQKHSHQEGAESSIATEELPQLERSSGTSHDNLAAKATGQASAAPNPFTVDVTGPSSSLVGQSEIQGDSPLRSLAEPDDTAEPADPDNLYGIDEEEQERVRRNVEAGRRPYQDE